MDRTYKIIKKIGINLFTMLIMLGVILSSHQIEAAPPDKIVPPIMFETIESFVMEQFVVLDSGKYRLIKVNKTEIRVTNLENVKEFLTFGLTINKLDKKATVCMDLLKNEGEDAENYGFYNSLTKAENFNFVCQNLKELINRELKKLTDRNIGSISLIDFQYFPGDVLMHNFVVNVYGEKISNVGKIERKKEDGGEYELMYLTVNLKQTAVSSTPAVTPPPASCSAPSVSTTSVPPPEAVVPVSSTPAVIAAPPASCSAPSVSTTSIPSPEAVVPAQHSAPPHRIPKVSVSRPIKFKFHRRKCFLQVSSGPKTRLIRISFDEMREILSSAETQ